MSIGAREGPLVSPEPQSPEIRFGAQISVSRGTRAKAEMTES